VPPAPRRPGAQPSGPARRQLDDDLRHELDRARLAWDAALLRSDRAVSDGGDREVRAALDDHQVLLQELEARLLEVVAAATPAETGWRTQAGPAAPVRRPRGPRWTSLAGAVAAVVLLAAVTVAEVIDLTRPTDATIARTVSDRDVTPGAGAADDTVAPPAPVPPAPPEAATPPAGGDAPPAGGATSGPAPGTADDQPAAQEDARDGSGEVADQDPADGPTEPPGPPEPDQLTDPLEPPPGPPAQGVPDALPGSAAAPAPTPSSATVGPLPASEPTLGLG
jgi:hypothetical protein